MLLFRSTFSASDPPKVLMDLLARKGLIVCVSRRACDAMVELVNHERRLRQGGHREPVLLIVVEPEQVPQAEDLVRASQRYAPHTACWRYVSKPEKKLQAFRVAPREDDDKPRWERPNVQMGPASRPGPRLVGEAEHGLESPQSPFIPGPSPAPIPLQDAPHLRLTGDDPPAPRPQAAYGRTLSPDEDVEVGEPRPLSAAPLPSKEQKSRRAQKRVAPPQTPDSTMVNPILSEEELSILLWDTRYPEVSG